MLESELASCLFKTNLIAYVYKLQQSLVKPDKDKYFIRDKTQHTLQDL